LGVLKAPGAPLDSENVDREARLDDLRTGAPGSSTRQSELQGEETIIESSAEITYKLRTIDEIPEQQPHNTEQNEQQSQSPADSSSSSRQASVVLRCECSYIPTFAYGPSPPIKLLRNDALRECKHFVAVSYCWQSSLQPLPPGPDSAEWIMHINSGEERPIRAPRRTLERTLEYAKAVNVALV
jgi:hypothetical protein